MPDEQPFDTEEQVREACRPSGGFGGCGEGCGYTLLWVIGLFFVLFAILFAACEARGLRL